MKYICLLIISCSLFNIGNTQNKTELIEEYLTALSSTMHGESTMEDVDKLTNLYTADIVYEHPKFGMRIESKEAVKKGMSSFLGSYGGTEKDAQIISSNILAAADVMVVEFEIRFLTKDKEEVSRKQIQVLELREGKISRIIDYW